MLIWRGHGIFVVAALVGSTMLVLLVAFPLSGASSIYGLPDWVWAIPYVGTGIFCGWWGRKLHSSPENLSPSLKRRIGYVEGQKHHLFFIPVEYWGLILGAGGVVSLVSSVLNHGG